MAAALAGGGTWAAVAPSDNDRPVERAETAPTTYALLSGAPKTDDARPVVAIRDGAGGLTVAAHYNADGQLCVLMQWPSLDGGVGACAAPGADGRVTPPAFVMPSRGEPTRIAGLAPDDVRTVNVIDEQGGLHATEVIKSAWSATLPEGQLMGSFELVHDNGYVERLGGR